jgi:hypothetical protein
LQPRQNVAIARGIDNAGAIAEHPRCLALGLFGRQAPRHQIGDALFQVKLKFVVDPVLDSTREKGIAHFAE